MRRKDINRAGTNRRDGAVAGRPYRFIRGHWNRKSPHRYIINPDTGCWVWQRNQSHGYGILSVDGVHQMAHRYYYESTVGPIPSGMQIDHLCRNTLCVNPDHMEVVTNAENGRRGAGAKLTWDDVAAIRDLCHQGVPHKDIASRYGTTASYVGQIRIGRTWADQDAPPVLS
jgi:hypothetical protein